MTQVWYCVNCGYEVETGGRCHRCGDGLLASPLSPLAPGELTEDDEVGYRLRDWDDGQRGRLLDGLVDRSIRHRFDGDEIVVGSTDENDVDQLVHEISASPEDYPNDIQSAPPRMSLQFQSRRSVRHNPLRDIAILLA